MAITEILEKLVEEVRRITGFPVKTSWISSSDLIPLITMIQVGGSCQPISHSKLIEGIYEVQVDIWAKSAKQRDEIFEKILKRLIRIDGVTALSRNILSIHVYRIADMIEENVYRKTFILVIREVLS